MSSINVHVQISLSPETLEIFRGFMAGPETFAASMTEPVPTPVAVAVPAPPAPEPESELDSAGVEWSEELHAASKAKNADGTWRKRRGGVVPPPPPPVEAVVPPPPVEAVVPPPPVDINTLIAMLSRGEITDSAVNAAVRELGHSGMHEIVGDPAKIAQVIERARNA